MTRHDLNRAVARATGETAGEIERRGFMPLEDLEADQKQLIPAGDELQGESFPGPFLRNRSIRPAV